MLAWPQVFLPEEKPWLCFARFFVYWKNYVALAWKMYVLRPYDEKGKGIKTIEERNRLADHDVHIGIDHGGDRGVAFPVDE
jgi:hypothetical protein